jgi:Cancer susceptibility candidate 1 N-terminus
MNTFLSLTSDIHLTDMVETMEFVRKMEAVANSVQAVYSNSLADGNIQMQSRSSGYIQQILNMINQKIDSATAHMLRFVDQHVNEKSEIFVEESANQISMGIWASYSDVRLIRKSIQFEKMGIQLDIPKQILNQDARYVHRILRIPIDSSAAADLIGLSLTGTKALKRSKKRVLGDVIQIDIILPPPQAFTIRAKKWTVRDNSAAAFMVQRSPYPSSVGSRCYFKVPIDVVMSDDVRIGLWDSENKDWTKEGLSDFQYSESTRMAQFHIAAVGTIALVRDRVWELPYKGWSLRATRDVNEEINVDVAVMSSGEQSMVYEVGGKHFEQQACFTLNTANHELVINIVGTYCVLEGPKRTEFSDLLGVPLSPGLLLTKLQMRGVNLLPTDEDLACVEGIVPKVSLFYSYPYCYLTPI